LTSWLRAQLAVEGQARSHDVNETHAALEEARAKFAEAEAAARQSTEEAERMERLHASGGISELDYLRAKSERQKQNAAAEALRMEINRREWSRQTSASDRRAHQEELRRDIAQLEGQIATGRATLERLRHDIELRTIRAPVAGKLGQIANLPMGSYAKEGERLGAVVPSGRVRVVAEFLPSEALGRIHAGQPARLRLDGFPWMEYGTVAATVSTIASEPSSGRVRVELFAWPESNPRIPFEHGLPGAVEIEVDRSTPASLVLRAAGRMLASPNRSAAAEAGK
jgi:membrane fusion protein (multidrug efflux system)